MITPLAARIHHHRHRQNHPSQVTHLRPVGDLLRTLYRLQIHRLLPLHDVIYASIIHNMIFYVDWSEPAEVIELCSSAV